MFEIKNVTKQYSGEFALNNVSLNIGKGLNFIVGASGSGKTTLLKIMSGMEQSFDGDVSYCGRDIKKLTSKEKSYFYNNVFGFVWQDFNLLEDSTVLENVMLPQYVKSNLNRKSAEKTLRGLKIQNIALQKVKYLSGGQKQRVAIARELMKNPQVIIADEPTSALDEKTAKTTMNILRTIAKKRTVIVVTHDTSLITEKDNVFELDKGELILKPEINLVKTQKIKMDNKHNLSLSNAFHLTKTNIKNRAGRFIISALSLVIASVLLLSTVSGAVTASGQSEFDKLLKTYGDSLTDINIINSFTDAAGTDEKEKGKPKGDVSQDIGGLYDLYAKDDRVSIIAYLQAFDDIKIKVGEKEYTIESSGSAPAINKMVAGNMPVGDDYEVAVPESFIKELKISPEEALGKEIDFTGSIVQWSSGNPVFKSTKAKAKIVGVIDTTVKFDFEGEMSEYVLTDSFFFSKVALVDMTKQAGTNLDKMNFLIRAKTPSDMIAIKDELGEKGIVPLGRFELVEDMVRLNSQAKEQSGSASAVIGALSLVMVVAIFLITGLMRKKEYAIYRVSGFHTAHLLKLDLAETVSAGCVAIITFLVTSPLINLVTKGLFSVNILTAKMMFVGVLLIIIVAVVAYFTTAITFARVHVNAALKAGDR